MSTAILLALLFFGVLMIIEGLYLVVFGKSIKLNSRMNRRLALLEQGKGHEEVLNTLRKEREQHAKSKKVPLLSILGSKATQANIAFSPKALIMIMGFIAVSSFAIILIATEIQPLIIVLISIAMGVGGVFFWLNNKAKARLALFEEQLPDAVELIVRSLRVGHPFSSAINVVAQEMADPIGTEFGMLADEATYGRDLILALEDLADRVDVQDLRFLTVAVGIQSQSGGNLAEVLDTISFTIRERVRIKGEIRTLTAQGRLSGWIISLLPIALALVLLVINAEYIGQLFERADPMIFSIPCGWIVIGIGLIMMIIGIIIIQKIVDIEV